MEGHALESWKGTACYDDSLLRLAIPWNVHKALETFLYMCYSFIALSNLIAVKAVINHTLN